jgi:hypothetical protein
MTIANHPAPADTPPRPEPSRRGQWEMLWFSVAALVLSAVLQVRGDGRVTVPGLSDHPLPHGCPSQQWFGVKCPGCGMTRSFIQLAHGRWQEAWSWHRLGWLLFLAAAAQVPYRLARIYRPGQTRRFDVAGKWFSWGLIALLLVNWCLDVLLRGTF